MTPIKDAESVLVCVLVQRGNITYNLICDVVKQFNVVYQFNEAQVLEVTELLVNRFLVPTQMVRWLARKIVAKRHTISVIEAVQDGENAAGWSEWTGSFYDEQIAQLTTGIEEVGELLYAQTGYLIPECDHSGDYPTNI